MRKTAIAEKFSSWRIQMQGFETRMILSLMPGTSLVMSFHLGMAVGDLKRIPQSARVSIDEIKIVSTGSKSRTVFGHAVSEAGVAFGWTSTKNLAGTFINETLGVIVPEAGAGRFGPNAAWSGGSYLKQIDLVEIVDSDHEIERIAVDTVEQYIAMSQAALENDDVNVQLNSGFRSYGEQKLLWEGFTKGLPGFNRAAKPGFSNHQNGVAFDIAVSGGSGNLTYDWLKDNATSFGFLRTVSREPWHWEYDPDRAEAAKKKGKFKAPGVSD